MEYRNLGRSGLKVSAIGLGTHYFGWLHDEATSVAIIDRALELGINFIDTADVYDMGRSEEFVGKANDRCIFRPAKPQGHTPQQRLFCCERAFEKVFACFVGQRFLIELRCLRTIPFHFTYQALQIERIAHCTGVSAKCHTLLKPLNGFREFEFIERGSASEEHGAGLCVFIRCLIRNGLQKRYCLVRLAERVQVDLSRCDTIPMIRRKLRHQVFQVPERSGRCFFLFCIERREPIRSFGTCVDAVCGSVF